MRLTERMRWHASWLAGLVMISVSGLISPALAQPEPPHLAFIGDSMSDGLWGGFIRLATKNACLSAISYERHGKNGIGLVRMDQADLVRDFLSIVQKTASPKVVVLSVGLNDRQDAWFGDRTRIPYGSEDWTVFYKSRLTQMMDAAEAADQGLVILGLPVLREAKANDDALAKNRLLADVVKAYGKPSIVFLPSPLDPAEGAQAFKSYDRIGGSLTQMRASDGVHFTQAGYDYLTQTLLPAILAVLQQKGWTPAGPCP
jgi:uncharacterized protein